jgi:hypothetical protein
MSSRRGKNHKANKRHESGKTKEKSKEMLKIEKLKTPLKSTPSNTLNTSSPH